MDVRNITLADGDEGELSAEQVAGYIAKYATKATESFGSGLDRRLGADDLDRLDRLPAHVAELVRVAFAKRRRGRDGVLLGAKLAFSVSLASRACVPDCPSRL